MEKDLIIEKLETLNKKCLYMKKTIEDQKLEIKKLKKNQSELVNRDIIKNKPNQVCSQNDINKIVALIDNCIKRLEAFIDEEGGDTNKN